jgi:DNA-directed RNA polymerase specialized sigma24 family protein
MPSFAPDLRSAESHPTGFTVEALAGVIDPAWGHGAIVQAGCSSQRLRRLPAGLTLWLVILLGLFRRHSYAHLLGMLFEAGVGRGPSGEATQPPSPPALARARDRLGVEPRRLRFERSARAWTQAARGLVVRGGRVFALDGPTMRIPDTPETPGHGVSLPRGRWRRPRPSSCAGGVPARCAGPAGPRNRRSPPSPATRSREHARRAAPPWSSSTAGRNRVRCMRIRRVGGRECPAASRTASPARARRGGARRDRAHGKGPDAAPPRTAAVRIDDHEIGDGETAVRDARHATRVLPRRGGGGGDGRRVVPRDASSPAPGPGPTPLPWAEILRELMALALEATSRWPNARWAAEEVAAEAAPVVVRKPAAAIPPSVRERGEGGWLREVVSRVAFRVHRRERRWSRARRPWEPEDFAAVPAPRTPWEDPSGATARPALPEPERRLVACLEAGMTLREVAQVEGVPRAEVERRGRWAGSRAQVPELASRPTLGEEVGSLAGLSRRDRARVATALVRSGWTHAQAAYELGATPEGVRSLVRRELARAR